MQLGFEEASAPEEGFITAAVLQRLFDKKHIRVQPPGSNNSGVHTLPDSVEQGIWLATEGTSTISDIAPFLALVFGPHSINDCGSNKVLLQRAQMLRRRATANKPCSMGKTEPMHPAARLELPQDPFRGSYLMHSMNCHLQEASQHRRGHDFERDLRAVVRLPNKGSTCLPILWASSQCIFAIGPLQRSKLRDPVDSAFRRQ